MKKITLLLFVLLASLAVVSASPLPITTGTLSSSIPDGWTYITNNESYPNPSFYSSGGLKMSFENQGIASPVFDVVNSIEVNLVLGALYANTKTSSASENVFTVEGLNTSNEVVSTSTLKSVVVGDNKVTLTGTGIVKVSAKMTGYFFDGEKRFNIDLKEVAIASVINSVSNPSATKFKATVVGDDLQIKNVANGATVEIFSALGSKVQTSVLESGKVSVENLSKGMYIVRVGRNTQKFILL